MKYLLPTILILASVGLFLIYINPNYIAAKSLNDQQTAYNDALNNSKKLQAVRDTLVAKYNAFPTDSLDKLSKLLPDNVDNIKLVLEVDQIAQQYNMQVKNIKYDLAATNAPVAGTAASAPKGPVKDYGQFELEFSVQGRYTDFISFAQSLENSLRIVDVESLTFSSTNPNGAVKGAPTDVYKYDFKIKTYWLKG